MYNIDMLLTSVHMEKIMVEAFCKFQLSFGKGRKCIFPNINIFQVDRKLYHIPWPQDESFPLRGYL